MTMEDFTDEYNQRAKFIADPVTWREARLDNLVDAIQVIDYEHHEHHAGSAYAVQAYVEAGTEVSICFKTPAGTKRAHLIYEWSKESKAHIEVLEGCSWTTNTGTVRAPKNQRRDSENTSMLLEDKTATPAYTAGGVLVSPSSITGGETISLIYSFQEATNQGGGGGGGSKRHELLLKPDETYAFKAVSDDGSKGLQIRLYWYEHTDTVPLV